MELLRRLLAERQTPSIPDIPRIPDFEHLRHQARAGDILTYANRPYLDTPDTDAIIARGPEAIAEGGERQLTQILRLPRLLKQPALQTQQTPEKPPSHQASYQATARELQEILADVRTTLSL